MTEHKHTFHLGFLNYKIEVIITDDLALSRSTYDQQIGHSCDDLDGVSGLHSFNSNKFMSYIFLKPDSRVDTIAHEAFHATCNACRTFDTSLKSSTEEIYAYMLDFIVGEIVKFKESINEPV